MALIEIPESKSAKDIGKIILKVLVFIITMIFKILMWIFYALHRVFSGIGNTNTGSDEENSSSSDRNKRHYYYCKWCGKKETSLRRLVDLQCRLNPHGRCCEIYEGGEKSEYTCKRCGNRFRSIRAMTNLPCRNNPNKGKFGRQGTHEPAL